MGEKMRERGAGIHRLQAEQVSDMGAAEATRMQSGRQCGRVCRREIYMGKGHLLKYL
jgi:hypothetical protein